MKGLVIDLIKMTVFSVGILFFTYKVGGLVFYLGVAFVAFSYGFVYGSKSTANGIKKRLKEQL